MVAGSPDRYLTCPCCSLVGPDPPNRKGLCPRSRWPFSARSKSEERRNPFAARRPRSWSCIWPSTDKVSVATFGLQLFGPIAASPLQHFTPRHRWLDDRLVDPRPAATTCHETGGSFGWPTRSAPT